MESVHYMEGLKLRTRGVVVDGGELGGPVATRFSARVVELQQLAALSHASLRNSAP